MDKIVKEVITYTIPQSVLLRWLETRKNTDAHYAVYPDEQEGSPLLRGKSDVLSSVDIQYPEVRFTIERDI